MNLEQALSFGLILAMMGLFVWGRWRYDLVAVVALLAALAMGLVPLEEAFKGFSDEIVVIIASALLVSAAVSRSGIVERAMGVVGPWLTTTRMQVFALVAAVTVMSGFVKNVGAVAILIPVVFQLARRTGTRPTYLLMPLAFGSLLGGIVTLVGTSPNIIVSRLRESIVGEPFRMFDFTPVGAGIAVAGVIFLTFAYKLLPGDRKGTVSMDAAFNLEDYVTEAQVLKDSPVRGKTVADLEALAEGDVTVTTILRRKLPEHSPPRSRVLKLWDKLLLQGEPGALERALAGGKLKLVRHGKTPRPSNPNEEIGILEAVVTDGSPLVGRTPEQTKLHGRHGLNLIAISRSGRRLTQRIGNARFRVGDVIVVQGSMNTLPEAFGELNLLPLAKRDMPLGRGRRNLLPVAVLGIAMLLVALHVVPVTIAFFGAAVTLLALGSLSLSEAYEAIDWPILVLIGALIPVSETLQSTGGTELIAELLSSVSKTLPALGSLALIMVAAMAVTPFLNNAATVLVMAPIAASFALSLGFSPDPFLMAVAIGAGCDFLTPIGHQCNTLVMGPGGYRFGDYWRLGLPLSVMVVVAGTPLVAFVWPLAGP